MEIKIKERLENYRRVLSIAKKPTADEFILTAKVCALGIAVVGVAGFLFYLLSVLLIG